MLSANFRIKDFLIWKSVKLLKVTPILKDTDVWRKLETFIAKMDPKKDLNSRQVRDILKGLQCKDTSPFTKVISLLKKYHERCCQTIRFVCALNEERALLSLQKRTEKISSLSEKLDKLFHRPSTDRLEQKIAKIFEGHNRRYRRFFSFERDKKTDPVYGYHINEAARELEKKFDGVFMFVVTDAKIDIDNGLKFESYSSCFLRQ